MATDRGPEEIGGAMEPITMSCTPAPTHDLIRLRQPMALTVDGLAPPWVEPALRRAPWVVVRRGYVQDNMIPVGVRGMTRPQRFAALLAVAEIAERLSPEELWDSVENRPTPGLAYALERTRTEAVPALAALARVAPLLARRGYRWGPGGSVGFELATGVATATASSDLDVIVRRPHRLEPDEARALQAALARAAAPARIDVLLETPCGGVSLADLARAPKRVLVLYPRPSSAYDIAITKILQVFQSKSIDADFSVVNFEMNEARGLDALHAAEADNYDLIFAMGSESTAWLYERYRGGAIPVVSVCSGTPKECMSSCATLCPSATASCPTVWV